LGAAFEFEILRKVRAAMRRIKYDACSERRIVIDLKQFIGHDIFRKIEEIREFTKIAEQVLIVNITLVAAIDNNRIIGSDNGMPWHIVQDLIHFRNYTLGKPVIYGRKTLESMGAPFKRRQSIILSRSLRPVENGATFCGSIEEALDVAKEARERLNSPDIVVAGGGHVYESFMPLANKMVITHVLIEASGNVTFPEIGSSVWTETDRTEVFYDERVDISFYTSIYKKN